MADAERHGWDHVIVGSGAAGGGTLAARLADDYEVPGFHAFAYENAAMSWNFDVRTNRIPGFFVASAVYMVAEKAADVLLHAATNDPRFLQPL